MKITIDEAKIQELFESTRYIDNIYPHRDFLGGQLRSGKQLSIYIGVDPTAPGLHLGHATNFLVLKKFQELGHRIIIVIGDFTGRIGDPTGKDETRKPLTEREVSENSKTYKQQIGKILDLRKVEFKQNSKWLDKISLKEFVKIASRASVQQLLHREMFQRRIKEEESIALHEFIYPLLQGYDSVAMNIDGEIGGTDQTFNMLLGRTLMEKILNKEKFVITTKLLENPLTGKKLMSKSEGNYISFLDSPQDMYSKIMALPDEVVFTCFELCTEVPIEKISDLKSDSILAVKRELANEITKIYHGREIAEKSAKEFEKVFSKKEEPTEIREFSGSGKMLLDFMVKSGLAKSRSEAKQLLEQGAVRINKEVIKVKDQWNYELREGDIIQVGPRRFFKAIK
ncbi:MAG: tyrosine--tRNA ligase [Patescibacteria group bacterium]